MFLLYPLYPSTLYQPIMIGVTSYGYKYTSYGPLLYTELRVTALEKIQRKKIRAIDTRIRVMDPRSYFYIIIGEAEVRVPSVRLELVCYL